MTVLNWVIVTVLKWLMVTVLNWVMVPVVTVVEVRLALGQGGYGWRAIATR